MEEPDSIFLNPIIVLPLPLAIATLAGILLTAVLRPRWGMAIVLLTVPLQRFVVIPGILGNRFTPHEAAFASMIGAILVRGRAAGFRILSPTGNPIAAPIIGLLIAGILSLFGNPFIEEGLSELIILAYLFLLMHLVYSFASAGSNNILLLMRAWYLTAALFCTLAAIGAIGQAVGIETFFMLGPRLVVTFFNANQAGSFLIASSFVFIARVTRPGINKSTRLMNFGFLTFSVVGGYFTASRATLLGGATGMVVFLLIRRVRLSAVVALVVVLVMSNWGLSQIRRADKDDSRVYDERYSEGMDLESNSAHVRMENWQMGIDMFLKSPIVGVGIGTLYLQAASIGGESYQVHNTYLSFLGETGLLGSVCLLAAIAVLVGTCVHAVRRARGTIYEETVAALVPGLVALSVFNVFHYGIRARHMWIVIALLLAVNRVLAKGPALVPSRSRVRATLAPVRS